MENEAQAAIQAAQKARVSADAILPVAIRTMNDLREQTLALADLMELYAKQLRSAVEGEPDA
jgi:hypothetical protein